MEARLLASPRRWNLGCRAGSLRGGEVVLFPLRPGCLGSQKTLNVWIGYKVHFTETCDEELPRLITHVTTDIGPMPDREALPEIHAALQQQEVIKIKFG